MIKFAQISSHRDRGFTIVELLVVIVVIAILATVTVVAYQGVQQRARESRVMTQLSQARKAMEAYRIEHDAWPFDGEMAEILANGERDDDLGAFLLAIHRYLVDNRLNSGSTGGQFGNSGGSYNSTTGAWTYHINVSATGFFTEEARMLIKSDSLQVQKLKVSG